MTGPKMMLLAGEPSGDALGADLLRQMPDLPIPPTLLGISGPQMQAMGCPTLLDQRRLSVMGIGEVLPKLVDIFRAMRETEAAIRQFSPDILITIDAPDFMFRIARRIQDMRPHTRILHYVAPSVWAWKPGRAAKIARLYDGLLCLLPFEPGYFTPHGLDARYVGHPASRLIARQCPPPTTPQLCLLPGSRTMEIRRLLPLFVATARRMLAATPDLRIVLPTLPHLHTQIAAACGDLPVTLITNREEGLTAMAGSTAALAASGTISLELACLTIPMVLAYKVHPLTAMIGRRLVKTAYAGLPNILAGQAIVPEILQEQCTTEALCAALLPLIRQEAAWHTQKQALDAIATSVAPPPDPLSTILFGGKWGERLA